MSLTQCLLCVLSSGRCVLSLTRCLLVVFSALDVLESILGRSNSSAASSCTVGRMVCSELPSLNSCSGASTGRCYGNYRRHHTLSSDYQRTASVIMPSVSSYRQCHHTVSVICHQCRHTVSVLIPSVSSYRECHHTVSVIIPSV